MFILEFLLSILYVLGIIVILLLVIALALPFAILFGVYWILFRSWKPKRDRNKVRFNKSKFNPKDLKGIIKRAAKSKKYDKDYDAEVFENDLEDIVGEVIESVDVSEEE